MFCEGGRLRCNTRPAPELVGSMFAGGQKLRGQRLVNELFVEA
jgi:hypothetical protein